MINIKKKTIKDEVSYNSEHFIVMGDIIKSSKYNYNQLKLFRKIIDEINIEFDIISPLTITLGDEFQGIAKSLRQSIKILFKIEEKLIRNRYPFELRYSIGYGKIITPINSDVAHGMYGEGLTKTRELLEKSKKDKRRRIDIFLPNYKFSEVLNDLLFVYQSFLDNWNEKDYEIVKEFYDSKDYKVIAKKLGKGNDQIWKREKNLRIREYFDIQEVILKLSNMFSLLYNSEGENNKYKNEFYSKISDTISKNINENKNDLSKIKLKNKLINDKLTTNFLEYFSKLLTS